VRLSRDDVLGLGMIVLAAAYWAAADRIPVSLLSDTVGADGVPKVLAVALGVCGGLLVATSRRKQQATEEASTGGARTHLRASGLLAGLAVYLLLLPVLGYPVAIALLIAGVAIYGGTAVKPAVAGIAVAGSAVFWTFFVKVLGVGLPSGIWAAGF